MDKNGDTRQLTYLQSLVGLNNIFKLMTADTHETILVLSNDNYYGEALCKEPLLKLPLFYVSCSWQLMYTDDHSINTYRLFSPVVLPQVYETYSIMQVPNSKVLSYTTRRLTIGLPGWTKHIDIRFTLSDSPIEPKTVCQAKYVLCISDRLSASENLCTNQR